jgi:hypothetical protein
MLMGQKLFIYDADDSEQAENRFDPGEVTAISAGSKLELIEALDRLVQRGATFDRVLVQTHGTPGGIQFGGVHIFDVQIRDEFAGRNYSALFPTYTRIYFDGCNVGATSMGTDFFLAVGAVFLRRSGGEVLGYTNPGYYMGWLPLVGGHTHHFLGELKTLYFGPNGVQVENPIKLAYPRHVGTMRGRNAP